MAHMIGSAYQAPEAVDEAPHIQCARTSAAGHQQIAHRILRMELATQTLSYKQQATFDEFLASHGSMMAINLTYALNCLC